MRECLYDRKKWMIMKIILKILGGILLILLLLLKPVFLVFSVLSGGILGFLGVILIVGGLLILASEGFAFSAFVDLIIIFLLGSVGMLAGPFLGFLDEKYDMLFEKLCDFVLG